MNILPVSGNEDFFGPSRLRQTDTFMRVGKGKEIQIKANGGFETRNSGEKWDDGNIAAKGKCVKLQDPTVKFSCDGAGYTKLPRKVVEVVRLLAATSGSSKLRIDETTTRSVKYTDSMSSTISQSLSTEGSLMLGVDGPVKLGANIKSVVTDTRATTTSSSVEQGKVVVSTRSYEVVANCAGPNPCYHYQVTSEYCETQDLSKCQFVDQLPEYSSFRPEPVTLKYCYQGVHLASSESPDETKVSILERPESNGDVVALLSRAETKQEKRNHVKHVMKKKKTG
jgi:hypothetical protein